MWRHSKSNRIYLVHFCAFEEATHQLVVVYQNQYSTVHWTRPLAEWHEPVQLGAMRLPRFVELLPCARAPPPSMPGTSGQ